MKTIIKSFLLLLCIYPVFHLPQGKTFTVSGYVQDSLSSEKLIGANIYETNLRIGTSTNTYGFFSLTLPSGPAAITFSFIGYRPYVLNFDLQKDTFRVINLGPVSYEMEAVEVTGEYGAKIEDKTQMSSINIPAAEIQKLPALLGEVDLLKVIQLLPGVKTGTEGMSGIYVRGGGADQNLILLDDAPVYNVSHLFGFFSVFNSDAVKNVTLIKGGFPARYGNRLSSVLDITMKDGNMKEFHGTGTIGLIAAKFTLEGPLSTDKTSFILSGRRTYADLILRPFMRKDSYGGYYFYDLNAKVNHIISNNDRLFLNFYLGNDVLYIYDHESNIFDNNLSWGNIISTLRWNHIYSSKLFGNTTFIFSRYKFDTKSKSELAGSDNYSSDYFSGIDDLGIKTGFDFMPAPDHNVRFGGSATLHKFTPEIYQVKSELLGNYLDTTISSSPKLKAWELSLYGEDDFEASTALKLNLGIHASCNIVPGKSYYSLQPRVGIRYLFPGDWALKASFAAMSQNIHLLSYSSIGFPNDLWVPATKKVKPQNSLQYALGAAHSFDEYEISVEGYYKKMKNIIEYKEGASFFFGSTNWEDKVEMGNGYAWGIEFFLQKKLGDITGWIGYTFSKTARQFETINFGKEFPAKFDRRHDLSAALVFNLYSDLDLSTVWVFGSGSTMTLPAGYYLQNEFLLYPYLAGLEPPLKKFYTEKNAYRMDAYHRLDLSLKYQAGNNVWTFSVYNVYNRKNSFFIYLDEENGKTVAKKVTLFPIIPSISYSYKF